MEANHKLTPNYIALLDQVNHLIHTDSHLAVTREPLQQ